MPIPGWGIFKNRVMGQMVGTAAGFAASDALAPPFRELVYELERALENKVLTPAELAELVVRGVRTEAEAGNEAANSGINRERFHELFLLAGNPPAPETLLELLNRGVIDQDRFALGVRQGRFRSEWIPELLALRRRPLTAAQAAEAAARGLQAPAEARGEASRTGISPERFELLERLAARPPTTGELLDLLNRGQIDEARARQALRDAGIRQEWADDVLELREHLAPPGDLIRFAVREVYSPEVAQRFGQFEDFPPRFAQEAARLGISPELARNYWAAHWDLPAPGQGFQMFHRAIIDRPTLQTLLRALDVMPFWRDRLIQLAYRVPGRIDIRRMFRFGVIDRRRLVRGYLDLGYSPEDAERLAVFAQREKQERDRDLTKAEWVSLYEEQSVSREQALQALDELGYDQTEAGLILGLADAKRARRLRAQLVRVVRSRYLAHAFEADEARRRMSAAGVPASEQDFNLQLWELERQEEPAEHVRHISEAQIRAAWRREIVDEAGYRRHLTKLAIPADEQEILVTLYRPG